jgi:hypothetical protein
MHTGAPQLSANPKRLMTKLTLKTTLALAFFLISSLAHAENPGIVKLEIGHLFAYLEASGCSFDRNGTWHDGKEASAHLHTKYRYLLDRGLVPSAEAFIDRAATRSSITGKPYRVRCGSTEPVESAAWFKAELARYREKRPHSR